MRKGPIEAPPKIFSKSRPRPLKTRDVFQTINSGSTVTRKNSMEEIPNLDENSLASYIQEFSKNATEFPPNASA